MPNKEAKSLSTIKLNPNGRLPILQDPNQVDKDRTVLTLWESGAIIEYLVEVYDTKGTISFVAPTERRERWLIRQWLHFQMSGQGPYFGQAGRFNYAPHSFPEYLPNVVKRYTDEVDRVLGVLDLALQDRECLVGNKCSVADLAFLGWDSCIPMIYKGDPPDFRSKYPAYDTWMGKMMERPPVKTALVDRRESMWTEG